YRPSDPYLNARFAPCRRNTGSMGWKKRGRDRCASTHLPGTYGSSSAGSTDEIASPNPPSSTFFSCWNETARKLFAFTGPCDVFLNGADLVRDGVAFWFANW